MRIINLSKICTVKTIVTLARSVYKKLLLTRVSFLHIIATDAIHTIAHCTLDFSIITQHN